MEGRGLVAGRWASGGAGVGGVARQSGGSFTCIMIPALQHSTSSPPSATSFFTAAAALLTDAKFNASYCIEMGAASPVAAAATSSSAAVALGDGRLSMITLPPFRATDTAVAKPSPRLAPVMATVLPRIDGMASDCMKSS